MTMYRVAFNEGALTAHIIGEHASLPEGTREIGEFNASAVSPNPSDASIQHIHGMLYRAGVSDPSKITVKTEPVSEVVERREAPTATEMGNEIAKVVPEADKDGGDMVSLAVGESTDLIDGSTRDYTFETDTEGKDTDVIKLDKRNAKVTALNPGTAVVRMIAKEGGATSQVTITVTEAIQAPAEPAKEPEAA